MTATTTSPADMLRALAGEQLQRDAWTRERLLAHQRERLDELLAHAAARSPYYRELLGDDPAAARLDELPTLPKTLLMDHWDRIVCDPRLRRAEAERHTSPEPYLGEFQLFTTSGASGLRGTFAYDRREWALAIAGSMRAMVRAGARPGDRVAGIGAPPGPHMSQRLLAAIGSGGPRLSVLTPLDEVVAALNAYQPEVLLGYPSMGGLLAGEQLAGRLRIAPRLLAFGSEPVTEAVRDRVQEAWGIDPGEYYASTEAPVIASSTPAHPRALELFEDLYVVEVVDADDRPVPAGTPGAKLLLTTLEHRTLPLIRYELSDAVTVSPEPNPGGAPWRHLSAIEGRTADTLELPGRSGGRVSVIPLRLGSAFAELPEVRQFQIVLYAERMEVRVVLAPGAPPGVTEAVRRSVVAALEAEGAVAPPIAVRPVAGLEREPGAAAKLKLVVDRSR